MPLKLKKVKKQTKRMTVGFINAISYRIAQPVTKVIRHPLDRFCYPICPRCERSMDREYMCFCDRCGQKLNWDYWDYAEIVVAPIVKNSCHDFYP